MAKLIDFIKTYSVFVWTILFVLFVSLSCYFGPSTDELHQQPYGRQVLNFYTSMGQNDSATLYRDDLINYYGGLIDMTPEVLQSLVPFDLFTIRHIIIAIFSFPYIFYGFKLGKVFGGHWGGILSMLLLVLLPRVIGEAFNNPKDTPFAATYLMSLYYIFMFLRNLPRIERRNVFMLAVSMGLSMSVRAGGLLLFAYFLFFLAVWIFVFRHDLQSIIHKSSKRSSFLRCIIFIYLGAYFVGILFWPAALVRPFTHPLEALTIFSKFPVTINTLFNGNWIPSVAIPKIYIFLYYLISNPEVIFAGLLLLFFTYKHFSKRERMLLFFLFFASIFPVATIILNNSPMYSGWRQVYFTFLPIVVISGASWARIIQHSVGKLKLIVIVLFAFLVMLPVSFMFRNFPHFYVYFNHISGGIEKNYAKYEMDYYGHSVNEATFWIKKNHPEWLQDTSIKIVSNVPYNMQKVMDRWNFKNYPRYVRYRERFDSDWDIAIFSPAFVDPEIMKNGYFKSKGVIHSINIDDKPIGIILKRTDKNDFYGKKALDSQNFPRAIEYLTKAVQHDPNNEIAWTNLGFAQLNSNQPNEAVQSLSNALKISPGSIMAKNYLAYAYLQSGNLSYAQSVLMNLIEENPNMPDPYRLLAQIYQQQGNGAMAQQYMSIYQQITSQMRQ